MSSRSGSNLTTPSCLFLAVLESCVRPRSSGMSGLMFCLSNISLVPGVHAEQPTRVVFGSRCLAYWGRYHSVRVVISSLQHTHCRQQAGAVGVTAAILDIGVDVLFERYIH